MSATFMNNHTKLTVLSSLLAALFNLSAQAGIYQYSPSGSGPIPQGGTVFSTEFTIPASIEHVITSVEIVLTFNDNASLTGESTGIQGLLNLGTDAGDPSKGFFPDVTRTSHGNRIYDLTFSDFNGLDPNDTWALVLWDKSTSGIENGLVSWTLDITAVPEPVTEALICFGALAAGTKLAERCRKWRPPL
jgi:hypothetical protein